MWKLVPELSPLLCQPKRSHHTIGRFKTSTHARCLTSLKLFLPLDTSDLQEHQTIHKTISENNKSRVTKTTALPQAHAILSVGTARLSPSKPTSNTLAKICQAPRHRASHGGQIMQLQQCAPAPQTHTHTHPHRRGRLTPRPSTPQRSDVSEPPQFTMSGRSLWHRKPPCFTMV